MRHLRQGNQVAHPRSRRKSLAEQGQELSSWQSCPWSVWPCYLYIVSFQIMLVTSIWHTNKKIRSPGWNIHVTILCKNYEKQSMYVIKSQRYNILKLLRSWKYGRPPPKVLLEVWGSRILASGEGVWARSPRGSGQRRPQCRARQELHLICHL